MNGRIEDGASLDNGESSQWALETAFWKSGKVPAAQWTSYWEHVTPLGGSEFGGTWTSGWVLNPARQKSRTEPLPSAHVTVTHFNGPCGAASVWKQEQFDLAPGARTGFNSLPAGNATIGQGCVMVTSDLPVVAFNGAKVVFTRVQRATNLPTIPGFLQRGPPPAQPPTPGVVIPTVTADSSAET